MITRTAIFEGAVKPGLEDKFFGEVETRLLPLWQAFPHALAVRWKRIVDRDPDAPSIAMIQEVDYPSRAHLAAAITSPQRDRARAMTMELLEMFEGRFYHLVSGTDDATSAEDGPA